MRKDRGALNPWLPSPIAVGKMIRLGFLRASRDARLPAAARKACPAYDAGESCVATSDLSVFRDRFAQAPDRHSGRVFVDSESDPIAHSVDNYQCACQRPMIAYAYKLLSEDPCLGWHGKAWRTFQ